MKPCLYAHGSTLPEAWENSIIALRDLGQAYPGRYWREGTPFGRNAQMTIRIERMLAEPMVHRGFTCTPEDLLEYRNEIMFGSQRAWEYTYHERIFEWADDTHTVDQFKYALRCLARKRTSHKAIVALANPALDSIGDGDGTHIPCLRHIGFELSGKDPYELNMYLHWRARDAINAAFNNLFGLAALVEMMAHDLARKTGDHIAAGGCIDTSDDYHVNGKDWHLAHRVVELAYGRGSDMSDRTWTTEQLRNMVGEE